MPPEEIERLLNSVATRAAEAAVERVEVPAPEIPKSWVDSAAAKIGAAIVTGVLLTGGGAMLATWRDVAVASAERVSLSTRIERMEGKIDRLLSRPSYRRDGDKDED